MGREGRKEASPSQGKDRRNASEVARDVIFTYVVFVLVLPHKYLQKGIKSNKTKTIYPPWFKK
jgi:hypothetical protein